MPNITSANTVLILWASDQDGNVLLTPQRIQGFAPEDIISATRVVPAETRMGIDGNLSAGFVPTEKKTEIAVMAGSPSNGFFDALQAAQDANFLAFVLFGTLTYTSIGRFFELQNGFLTGYSPFADAKKVLEFRRYEVTWQNIIGIPIGAAG